MSSSSQPLAEVNKDGTQLKREQTPREITDAINPSTKRRILTILTFPLLMLAAVPYWWWTTSITRLALPVERIAALESVSPPPTRTLISFTADTEAFPDVQHNGQAVLHQDILHSLAELVHAKVDSIYRQQHPHELRNWELIPSHFSEDGTDLQVHIGSWDGANPTFPLKPYVHFGPASVDDVGIKAGTLVIPVHPLHIQDRSLRDHFQIALVQSLLSLYPPTTSSIPLRAIKYQPNVTLSFVLLNEDAAEGGYVRSWDIAETLQDHFEPHLAPLRDIFNFSIESQVLYHAPLTFKPSYGNLQPPRRELQTIEETIQDAEAGITGAEQVAKELIDQVREEELRGWGIDQEMMKVFVNSERWSLDSGSSNNPVLRFLLFVPSVHHRPIHLAVPDSADSFLLPQYGSVVLLNPPSSSPSTIYHLNKETLTPSFHLFTQHLYSLLALPPLPLSSSKVHPPPSISPSKRTSDLSQPISAWQVNQIQRQRAKENSEEARKTLVGIVRLVKKIKEMKVGAGVRDLVLGAVEALEKMDRTTDVKAHFLLSRDAVALANQAFFDPSMMGLLYFPDEHKFAVYTPLFAPVLMPIILALLKELLGWRRRRKLKGAVTAVPSTTATAPKGATEVITKSNAEKVLEAEAAALEVAPI